MPEKVKGCVRNPSSTLIAFKPRQVLLAAQYHKPSASSKLTKTTMADKKQQRHQNKTLTAGDKTALLHSVLRYLETNHFSKSLKRLLKDAQIQGDGWKASSLGLEDIYSNYLENCNHVDSMLASHKELETRSDELENHGDAAGSQEAVNKKKEKRTDVKDGNGALSFSENKSSKDLKKKNKDKLKSESLDQDAKQSGLNSGISEEKLKNDNGEIDFKETTKSKDKKKKNKSKAEHLIADQKNELENSTRVVDDKSNCDIPLKESEVKPEEKKRKKERKEKKYFVTSDNGVDDINDTKKRKRSASTENENEPVEESVPGETKCRKIEGLEESKNVEQKGTANNVPGAGGEDHAVKESGKENGKVGESRNGNSKNGTQKSGQKKQLNGSSEPKTVNAFQRVKVDEVQFVDDRLQDNSYWAKDGAENGYGAKAQEVLGQVRGRDFRHEKTKKKRGSYRGGLIDLQSHSIKFNYSDEE